MKNRKSYIGVKRAKRSRKIRLSWDDMRKPFLPDTKEDVVIEFGSAKKLRDFINSGERICKIEKSIFLVIQIKKFKQTSMEATVEKITLREYNLERLVP